MEKTHQTENFRGKQRNVVAGDWPACGGVLLKSFVGGGVGFGDEEHKKLTYRLDELSERVQS